jgi:hypothetical protein
VDRTLESNLLEKARELVDAGATERVGWIRANTRSLMAASGRDAIGISALSGVSPGTVRGFLGGTDSSLTNVLRIAITLGVALADLERPPAKFAERVAARRITS